jgi:type 1 glutamine amidotransferase
MLGFGADQRGEHDMMRWIGGLLLALAVAVAASAAETRVLVYTRNHVTNGKGFVHGNIASGVEAIRKLGQENGFAVDVSDDPTLFTDDNLRKYQAVIFANSNNEAFSSEEQKASFQRFIRAGGGFVGIHSATGSERKWPWYWQLIGGTFAWHHPLQPFTVKIADKKHPSTSVFEMDTWEWVDEFYTVKERAKDLRVLMAGDLTSLKKPAEPPAGLDLPDPYPLVWCHEFEGGRAWYTALGHKNEHYQDPLYLKHLLGGIQWAMRTRD